MDNAFQYIRANGGICSGAKDSYPYLGYVSTSQLLVKDCNDYSPNPFISSIY